MLTISATCAQKRSLVLSEPGIAPAALRRTSARFLKNKNMYVLPLKLQKVIVLRSVFRVTLPIPATCAQKWMPPKTIFVRAPGGCRQLISPLPRVLHVTAICTDSYQRPVAAYGRPPGPLKPLPGNSEAIVMYTIPKPCGTYVHSLK